MAQILVRELEDDVVDRLKTIARRQHRSLEGEVRAILTEVANRDRRHEEFLKELDELHASMAGQPQTDSVELLREARAELEAKWD